LDEVLYGSAANGIRAVRKFLHILGVLALIAILPSGVALGVFFYKGRALDAESKAFIDDAIPAIATAWSKQQFLDRAAPELRARVKPEELNAIFDRFSQLCPLVEYQGASGRATMSYMSGIGSTVSAAYIAKARCQNGSATFRIGLLKRDGRWMIRDFYINTPPGTQAARGA
jgi:hypothetical protein